MNIINGRSLAEEVKLTLKETVANLPQPPTLVIVTCAPNLATTSYLELKKRTASAIGIPVSVMTLPPESSTTEVVSAVKAAAVAAAGVIVQLPLPSQIDTATVLEAIPKSRDVDNFSYVGEEGEVLPPVIGAIDYIAKAESVSFKEKSVVIFGQGRLVGVPAFHYAQSKGAQVTIITKETTDEAVKAATLAADIIILGVGKAQILRPDMVKKGVVVFDAGASEEGGVLVGDADSAVAEVAALFTPVPGGIGPLTVAWLFCNLLELAARQ